MLDEFLSFMSLVTHTADALVSHHINQGPYWGSAHTGMSIIYIVN